MIKAVQARLAGAPPANGPKYKVLRDAILSVIASGEWKPGMRLPTEMELAQLLPYSLGTIQKAYGELVKNGVVVRSRGRGSFVAPTDRRLPEPWHCRFLGEDGAILPIYPRVTGYERKDHNPRWAELFGAGVEIARIDRALSVNDEFEVVSRFYAKQSVIVALLDQFETANFKATLHKDLGLPIARIVQTISVPETRSWQALGMHSRPHLVLEATACAADEIAYFQELYIPRNRRRLLFDSQYRG